MEHIEEVYNLFYGIGRPRLLSVSESGIRNKDLFRRIDEDKSVIEFYPTDFFIRKDMSVKIGFLNI
jgi:hypothetical protein